MGMHNLIPRLNHKYTMPYTDCMLAAVDGGKYCPFTVPVGFYLN